MEVLIEEVLIYATIAILCIAVVWYYLRSQAKASNITKRKIAEAKEAGMFEPVSLHPVVDANSCIKSGACIAACPEHDILGIVDGKATSVNASACIGHGACFHACPVEAITLCIGTEKRGVDLPHVNQNFETNVKGIYIAGELGGMGLIRNAVEQGKQAIENILSSKKYGEKSNLDVLIVGAGPAGISAALMCTKAGLSFEMVDQETLGGTVFTFPRDKVVMTNPMHLPLYGKLKLFETNKLELLDIWKNILSKHNIQIREKTKVDRIIKNGDDFIVKSADGNEFNTENVVLAIGRRGTPRKLNVPGEELPKVAYRLLEPERIFNKKVLVVGGGDSAIESALLLAENNEVTLSYRSDKFKRLKPKNRQKIQEAIDNHTIKMLYNSNVVAIEPENIQLNLKDSDDMLSIENDMIYIFAGGELPTSFLEKTGIQITKRFGHAMLKH